MVFRGIELDFDIFDADVMDDCEDAAARLDAAMKSSGKREGERASDAIRRQCQCFYDFFDDVCGEGVHKRIFGDRNNLKNCVEAFNEFFALAHEQKLPTIQIPKSDTIPAPNRAARRAASR